MTTDGRCTGGKVDTTKRSIVAGIAVVVFASLAPAAISDPASAITRVSTRFGSFVKPRSSDPIVTGDPGKDAVLNLESEVGRKLSIDHVYYSFDQAWPGRRQKWDRRHERIPLINWSPDPEFTWVDVAEGKADALIDARAKAAVAFGSKILLSFSHEPENDVAMGTPADYVAAWRHVVSRFRKDGATHVRFVLILMSSTYNQGKAGRWYPGSRYINVVGADGYNWHGAEAGQRWRAVKDIFRLGNRWAKARGRRFMITETGCLEDPADPHRKENWFLAAARWLAKKGNSAGFVYFNSDAVHAWRADSSAAALHGYRFLGESVS
jgi:Glycosyl hydrolase family 26